jgi:PPOX class probable F420-dependent enzyme
VTELGDDLRKLLQGPNYAHVASVLPDGSPHSVAVWVGVEDGRVAFFTQTGSRKARNLDRDGRVAISVTDHENPYRSGWVRGRVVERRTGDEALEAMDRLSVVYTGEPFPMRGPNGVLYVIEPERVGFVELPFTHRPGVGG